MLDCQIPTFIKPMQFVRFWMGNDSQSQLINQPCTTTIATWITINNERTSVF